MLEDLEEVSLYIELTCYRVSFYYGFAIGWKYLLQNSSDVKARKRLKAMESLIGLIQNFPYENPMYEKLQEDMERVRSKFRQLWNRVDGASEREGGRENEAGRWKVSENVQEFQEQVASGDMKGGRDKCNRRALEKKGLKLNGGIVSPFFALVPHTPHSFPRTRTHTHTQAPISALSCSLPRMVHDVDDKCAIPIHSTDKKGSATSLR
ncbi:putative oral cancer-overexpressed protein 1 [Labeo rohita]|uniref:Putative oral cancer-overexpressed protein 1 n=1 Tax=Labeo rohita TaxID=84645 RepID=A0A498P2F1_LABRO|nr:putative oral cancer-overexpressed protein 1 [Labeo rohita]